MRVQGHLPSEGSAGAYDTYCCNRLTLCVDTQSASEAQIPNSALRAPLNCCAIAIKRVRWVIRGTTFSNRKEEDIHQEGTPVGLMAGKANASQDEATLDY